MFTKRNNHTIVHVDKRKIARIKWSTTKSITGFQQHSSDKITTAQTTLLNGYSAIKVTTEPLKMADHDLTMADLTRIHRVLSESYLFRCTLFSQKSILKSTGKSITCSLQPFSRLSQSIKLCAQRLTARTITTNQKTGASCGENWSWRKEEKPTKKTIEQEKNKKES